jgi:NitT/TauT family transport system substrate-binding protein
MSISIQRRRAAARGGAVMGTVVALAALLAACGGGGSSSGPAGAGSSGGASSGGASSGGASGTVTNVSVGYVPYSDDAALFYAQDGGIFRKHGLNVTFVPQASPVAVEASMASGTEQFGFITVPVLINLNSKGVQVKCVSSVDGNQPSSDANDSTVLVAAKGSGITSIKGLAGKNIAEVQLTSLNSLAVEVLAKRAGIDPASVHLIAMPFPQMPAALAQGRVQAAVIVAPFTSTALAEGAVPLIHPNVALFPNGTVTCLDVMGSYASAHSGVVAAFRAAMNESIAYSQAHQSQAKATLSSHLSLSSAQAQAQILSTDWNPTLNPDTITQIEGYMKEFGLITSEPPAASMIWSPGS